MYSTTMVTFCKNANCPTSQQLLAFQKEESSNETGKLIKTHIQLCEFCDTEVDFYGSYPQSEETVESEMIPPPLYELAEALLKNNSADFSTLDELLGRNFELELKKV